MTNRPTVRVTIRLFARLREITGSGELAREVGAPADAQAAWEALTQEFPALGQYRPVISCAVNEQYAKFDTPLADGDEVAFLPPVSGGGGLGARGSGLGTRDSGLGDSGLGIRDSEQGFGIGTWDRNSGFRISDQGLAIVMFDKLAAAEAKYDQLMAEMANPSVQSDTATFRSHSKALAEIQPLVEAFRDYKRVISQITAAEELLQDADMRELAQEELAALTAERDRLLAEIKVLLVPKDPNDEKNVVLEIRAGTGGDEAALFAGDLFRMYSRYAERQGWKVDVLNLSDSGGGGIKEVVALIEGRNVYSRMKYESGVHRVQRVPATEASGRIHTSTATVAVLPEAEEVDIQVDQKDLRVDTFCSSGPGGQSVNTTYSAVRITHIPTGLVVSQQDEKSQIKNRAKAMKVLRSRLYEMEMRKQQEAIAKDRKTQVGTGERSEKIRTYNFRENRITDHRFHYTMHQLTDALDGNIAELIDQAVTHEQSQKLSESSDAEAAY